VAVIPSCTVVVTVAEAVNVTEQLAVPVTPATRVQEAALREPALVLLRAKPTLPVGVTAVPVVVESLTVAVQLVDAPGETELEAQATVVVVVRGLTVTVAAVVLELPL